LQSGRTSNDSGTEGATPAVPSFNWDEPFSRPQYLVHTNGHGSTSGGVPANYFFLYPVGPANGGLTLPDGSGGTIPYSIDFSSGPYSSPREVCAAAQGQAVGSL